MSTTRDQTKMTVSQDFVQTALSFCGCDGGNMDSPIWACGLEYGGGHENNQITADELKAWPLCSWDTSDGGIAEKLSYQYNQKMAWFFAYFFDWNIDDYRNEAVANSLFCASGIGFKMNAFPISFAGRNSVEWSELTVSLTGLNSFNDYREWCVEHRGKFFQHLMGIFNPKIILCTGKTSANEFIQFFGGCSESYETIDNFHVAVINDSKTLLYVVPFFGGASGINSFEKMRVLAEKIKDHSTQYNGGLISIEPPQAEK